MGKIDIERAILGQILTAEKEDQIDFYSQLGERYFHNPKWKNYFNAFGRIIVVHKEELNSLSIHNECKDFPWYSLQEVNEIMDDTISTADTLKNIAILKERSYRKELLEKLDKKVEDLKKTKWHDELEEAKDNLIAEIDSIELDTGSNFIDWTVLDDKVKSNMDNIEITEGYSWGIDTLDSITNGITNPKFWVIGALKKAGKSRFVVNTREALARQGIHSPFLSLEMPPMELAKLHYARRLGIPDNRLRSSALLSDEEIKKVREYKMDWTYFPTECISSIGLSQVLARIRKYSKLFPGCVIFIDYLQRIKHDRNKQAQELEEIATSIADTTRQYDVSVIALAQLQNLAERETPSIGHLKGSGGMAEGADGIILLDNLYRREKKDENIGKFQMHIEQRYGDSGIIDIQGDLGICHYYDEYTKYNHFKEDDNGQK